MLFLCFFISDGDFLCSYSSGRIWHPECIPRCHVPFRCLTMIYYGVKKVPTEPALPIIEIRKVNKHFKVEWDYQEAQESRVLHRQNDELTIFIDGVLVGMGISEDQISCSSGCTGTVTKLDESSALKLSQILKDLLFPLVAAESRRIAEQEKLPEYLKRKEPVEA